MVRFLLFFLTTYTAMHAFVYSRLRMLLPWRWPFQTALVLLLIVMIVAPVVARLLERQGYDGSAKLLGTFAFPWMGFVFLLFCAFLLIYSLELLSGLANRLLGLDIPSLIGPKKSTLIVLIGVFGASIYGYFEAENVRVERVVIETHKLPPHLERIRIAQISDLHLGLFTKLKRVEKAMALIRNESPDLLISTGDLIDGDIPHFERIKQLFDEISAPLGKYAVTGNHEAYAGLIEALTLTERLGFSVLQQDTRKVGDALNIVGVDDPAIGVVFNETDVLSNSDRKLFTLLLKHRPEIGDGVLELFDLQLSGHTHGGQIYPFRYITGLAYPLQNGLHQIANFNDKFSKNPAAAPVPPDQYDGFLHPLLYSSRGTGTWGPPMRILSPPEVTIIELVRVSRFTDKATR